MNTTPPDGPTECTLKLSLENAPPVLSRIMLIFSRRRLRLFGMRFVDDDAAVAELEVDIKCPPAMALDVEKQLRRIPEVASVSAAVSANIPIAAAAA